MQKNTHSDFRPAGDDLSAILRLEQTDPRKFLGRSPDTGSTRVFGGQLTSQSVVAAGLFIEDAEDYPVHSIHTHFFRPANSEIPIVYDVSSLRDSKAFRTRQVEASQSGKLLCSSIVSHHIKEDGYSHQDEMPAVLRAEEVKIQSAEEIEEKKKELPDDLVEKFMKPVPAIARFITNRLLLDPEVSKPDLQMWWRAADSHGLSDSENNCNLHSAALCWITDQ